MGTDLPSSPGSCVLVRVPAKLNLFLAVRGRRPDDYHELVSVMQTVAIYDELTVSVVGPPGRGQHPAGRRRMRLELAANGVDGLPSERDNLAVVGARLLGERTGVIEAVGPGSQDAQVAEDRAGPRTIIGLRKAIPVAAGMAGGSCDAAGALIALNELWDCGLARDELRELGAEVGSDVPFCVVGGTALATGTGTALARVLSRGTFHWLAATSRDPLRTHEVFRAWDVHCRPSEIEPDAVLAALRNQDPEALGAALHNDLQEAAFRLKPELAEHRDALLEAGALGAVLSGSGPTLLALAQSAEHAGRIGDQVAERFADTIVTRSPVGGPELREC